MIRLENQSPAAFQINRELSCPVPAQRVRPSSHKLGNPAGGLQIGQPGAQFAGTGRAELAFRHIPPFTQFTKFLVLEVNFHGRGRIMS
ncbi:MAG: hypothetical protein ACYC1T_10870 [Sulfuricaulis sp.]